MKLYRFSPIENKEQLMEALEYIHFTSFELCKKAFGKYLPVVENIGVFCHYQKEFEFLSKLGEELTNHSVPNFNGKYFLLYKPIVIKAKDDVPETTYKYLYIRQPDRFRPQVGDLDFVIEKSEFEKIKNSKIVNDVEIFDRSDLGVYLEIFNPDFDVLVYLTTKTVTELLKA